jgi:predicted aspartyl protease
MLLVFAMALSGAASAGGPLVQVPGSQGRPVTFQRVEGWYAPVGAPAVVLQAPVRSNPEGQRFVQVALLGADVGWWLVDTGAEACLVDGSTLAEAGVEAAGEAVEVEGTTGQSTASVLALLGLQVGDGGLPAAVSAVAPFADFLELEGAQVRGILGRSAFGGGLFVLGADTLILAPPKSRAGRGLIGVRSDFSETGTPVVAVRIDGLSLRAELDTGAQTTSVVAGALGWDLPSLPPGPSVMGIDGTIRTTGLKTAELRVGRLRLAGVDLAVVDSLGDEVQVRIGTDVLGDRLVAVDYHRGRVHLTP